MLRLALVWHQHQPYYRAPESDTARLPWVRLHATKDYIGMARLIAEAPRGVRATINIVPSLGEQLLDFASGRVLDAYLRLAAREVRTLSAAERDAVVRDGFHANERTMIAAFPRYAELKARRDARLPFDDQDLLDLEVLFPLSWGHRTLFEGEGLWRRLRERGRGFTEADKRALFDEQRAIAAEVLPLHRRLEEEGRIEVTSTPYAHPILPLLCDFKSAFQALPWLESRLGFEPVSLVEDAREHVRRAVAFHERTFGRRPRAMWPAEGSVSEAIVPLLAGEGVSVFSTDEEILAESLRRPLRRDDDGNLLDGEILYRPWRVRVGGAEACVLFRDHRLSDLFGFHYHRDAERGVDDFLRRLAWIRDHGPRDPLVTVVLDGENAWEHYPECGVPFLRALYRRLAETPWLRTVTVSEAVETSPVIETLPRLFAGSWIDHNFYVWIGHEQDREAWRRVLEARQALEGAAARGVPPETIARARESLLLAEGSDWCWWYGDDRSSGMDDVFDEIFRAHVRRVHELSGSPLPAALERPIKGGAKEALHDRPLALLRVRIDGRETSFFEWRAAGRFLPEREAGSMERAQSGEIAEVRFGADADRLLVGVELRESAREDSRARIVLRVQEPEVRTREALPGAPLRVEGEADARAAWGPLVELGVPWRELGVQPGGDVRFHVELWRGDALVERAPRGSPLAVTAPDARERARTWLL